MARDTQEERERDKKREKREGEIYREGEGQKVQLRFRVNPCLHLSSLSSVSVWDSSVLSLQCEPLTSPNFIGPCLKPRTPAWTALCAVMACESHDLSTDPRTHITREPAPKPAPQVGCHRPYRAIWLLYFPGGAVWQYGAYCPCCSMSGTRRACRSGSASCRKHRTHHSARRKDS